MNFQRPTFLHELNSLSHEDFTQRLGSVVEHAPWVAAAVWERRPFSSIPALCDAFKAELLKQKESVWLEVLNNHPELSGKEASNGTLTHFSAQEQDGIGLLSLSHTDWQRLQDFNRSYRDKFGFPFVVCVRNLKSLAELFAQQECRLQNARPTELTSAIREVGAIAQLRVESFIRE